MTADTEKKNRALGRVADALTAASKELKLDRAEEEIVLMRLLVSHIASMAIPGHEAEVLEICIVEMRRILPRCMTTVALAKTTAGRA